MISTFNKFLALTCLTIHLSSCSVPAEELYDQTKTALNTGQNKKADSLATIAIEEYPDRPEGYNLKGVALFNEKKYFPADECFTNSIKLDSSNYKAFYNRGKAKYELSKYDEATHDFEKAILLNPKEADIYNNRGLAFAALKKFDKAESDFCQAINLNSKDKSFYFNRAQVRRGLNKLDDAIKDFEVVLAKDSTNTEAQLWLGISFIESGKKTEGCELLKHAAAAGNEHAILKSELLCGKAK